jgi:hypothetical protein
MMLMRVVREIGESVGKEGGGGGEEEEVIVEVIVEEEEEEEECWANGGATESASRTKTMLAIIIIAATPTPMHAISPCPPTTPTDHPSHATTTIAIDRTALAKRTQTTYRCEHQHQPRRSTRQHHKCVTCKRRRRRGLCLRLWRASWPPCKGRVVGGFWSRRRLMRWRNLDTIELGRRR